MPHDRLMIVLIQLIHSNCCTASINAVDVLKPFVPNVARASNRVSRPSCSKNSSIHLLSALVILFFNPWKFRVLLNNTIHNSESDPSKLALEFAGNDEFDSPCNTSFVTCLVTLLHRDMIGRLARRYTYAQQ